MKNIKALLSLKRVSLFLIGLPYLAFNLGRIYNSPIYSWVYFISIILGLAIIDLLVKFVLLKFNNKWSYLISFVIIFLSILYFYGYYFTLFFHEFIYNHTNILVRGREMILISALTFILIVLNRRHKIVSFKYFNVFLFLFSIISLISSVNAFTKKSINKYKSNYIAISSKPDSVKPVILIISDEYNSPEGLFKLTKDSSVFDFSTQLTKNGWLVKNSFYSYETSTIHSLSSLFNYNLSKQNTYGQEDIANIGKNILTHAAIADSFEKKKVNVLNFGIFHIGKVDYLSNLYMYPKTFYEDLLMYTYYYTLKYKTWNFRSLGLTSHYYLMEVHNKYILQKLTDSIQHINNNKMFVYTHLMMPHSPLQLSPDFPLKPNNVNNYIAYWNFTNTKLTPLLDSLTKENKYRIILTGDHGFRGDKRINPHYTFTAFYGFDQQSIDSIKSVQDLGSLINASY